MSERFAYLADGPASVDGAVRAIAPALELELVEVAADSGASRAFDDSEAALHLAAQTLGLVESLGLTRVLTSSDAVTLHLRRSAHRLAADVALRARVNARLAEVGAPPTSGAVDVQHLVWELASERALALLHEHCLRPLEDLRVALLRGCQLLRPSRDLGASEQDLLRPLGRVVAACGASEVPIESGSGCCGAACAETRPEIALGAAAVPLVEAVDADAEALVVASSRCYAMLRDRREQIARNVDRELALPVLHVSQLVALAFGLRGGELQLDRVSAGSRALTERLVAPV